MTSSSLFSSVTLVCESDSRLLPYVMILDEMPNKEGVKSFVVNCYSEIESRDAAFFYHKGRKYILKIEDAGGYDDE